MTNSLPLGLLEVSGLIRQSGGAAGDEYMFRHTLMQETVYGTLLREQRTDLHRAVGRAIERTYTNGMDERASVLAEHFLKGGERSRAAKYFKQAGDRAGRVYATAEALEHYGKALELAKQGFGGDGDVEYLYERRGRMLELAGRFQDATVNYQDCEEYGREISDPRIELRGMVRRASLYCYPNPVMDLAQGEALTNATLARAREVGDREIECLALWTLLKKDEYLEDYEHAAEVGRQALKLAEELGLDSLRAFIANDLTPILMSTGNMDDGWRLNQEAQALWTELDNLPMLTDSLSNEMVIHVFRGKYDRALAVSKQARELSEKINNLWGQSYSRYVLYWVHFDRGEIALALETARLCLDYGERAGFVVPLTQTMAEIGLMHAYVGEYELAIQTLEKAVENADKYMSEWKSAVLAIKMLVHTWAGQLDLALGLSEAVQADRVPDEKPFFSLLEFVFALSLPELELARGDPEAALRGTESSLKNFERHGMLFAQADVRYLRARAHLELGRYEAAGESLREADRLCEKLGSRRVQWRVLAAMAGLAETGGDREQARELRERAVEIIHFIGDHLESPAQRDSFLSREPVRAVLAGAQDAG